MGLKKFSVIRFKGNNAKYFVYNTINNNTFEALSLNPEARGTNLGTSVKIKRLTNGQYGLMDIANKKQIIIDDAVAYIPTKNEFKEIMSTLNSYSDLKPLPAHKNETQYNVDFKQVCMNNGKPERYVKIHMRNML
ncbi:MAG: hypothetical protein PHI91_02840 [Candidatus Pacebacteria bacterium]|nr:hypothetical protein [Candidatus Paceibacterota bacterium]